MSSGARRIIAHINVLLSSTDRDSKFRGVLQKSWESVLVAITADRTPLLGTVMDYMLSNMKEHDIVTITITFNNGAGLRPAVNMMTQMFSRFITDGRYYSENQSAAADCAGQLEQLYVKPESWMALVLLVIILSKPDEINKFIGGKQSSVDFSPSEIKLLEQEEAKTTKMTELAKPYLEVMDLPGLMDCLKAYFMQGGQMTIADLKSIPDYLQPNVQALKNEIVTEATRRQRNSAFVDPSDVPPDVLEKARRTAVQFDDLPEFKNNSVPADHQVTAEEFDKIMRNAYREIYKRCVTAIKSGTKLDDLPTKSIPRSVLALLQQWQGQNQNQNPKNQTVASNFNSNSSSEPS